MEALKFKNFTTEDFTWNYNGVAHTFKAGQEIYLEDFKAHFFAKHLADRECNRLEIPTNDPRRNELEAKCFPVDEVVSVEEAVNIEGKKASKKGKKVVVEEEFPDLNND